MRDDQDDDELDEAEYRRAEYERMFGTPEEQAAEAREMEERAKQIKHDEVMAWCRQRAEEREAEAREAETSRRREVPCDGAGRPLPVVTKAYGAPVTQPAAAMSRDWADYISRAIRKELAATSEAMCKGIAQTLGKDIVELERSNADLRERLQHAENEIADLFRTTRAQARDAEIAERFKQYDELQERLDRLEGTSRRMKVVG